MTADTVMVAGGAEHTNPIPPLFGVGFSFVELTRLPMPAECPQIYCPILLRLVYIIGASETLYVMGSVIDLCSEGLIQ